MAVVELLRTSESESALLTLQAKRQTPEYPLDAVQPSFVEYPT